MRKNVIHFKIQVCHNFKLNLRCYTCKHNKIYNSIKLIIYMALINIQKLKFIS